jgi:hypothetical protein
MDAMALLCTLHADGPATLKNLRQAGCASLEAVESMGEERLAKILGTPAAAARRFAREARHLKERLGNGTLEREETSGDAATVSAAPAPEAIRAPERPRAGTDVVEEALAAWRARDLAEIEDEPENETENEEVSAEADDLAPRPARARPEFEFGTELVAAMREIAEPGTEIAPPVVVGMTAGEIDGLDEELCRRFAEMEIRSLSDLATTDPLELSSASGLGYTQVWRLQRLARRALTAESDASSSLVLVPYKVSLSEVARQEDPSILELEWNRELRPTPPPPRATAEAPSQEAERDSAGGPFA